MHEWNALSAGEGFKLVDPDGLLAEPEYDLGIIMREDPLELLRGDPRDRAEMLARRTGLDAEAIWEWGVVERVSTGLLGTRVGLQPVAIADAARRRVRRTVIVIGVRLSTIVDVPRTLAKIPLVEAPVARVVPRNKCS